MKRFTSYITAGIALTLATAIFSCNKKSDDNKTSTPDFDRKAMLTNWGNNIVAPGFQNLNTAVTDLDAAIADFNQAPDGTKLAALQSKLTSAYQKWEVCEPMELGLADQDLLNVNANTFPASVTLINQNIAAGSYSLSAVSNLSAKGFPALDYLLLGAGTTSADILAAYTTDANATNRKKYLADVSADLKSMVSAVSASWSSAAAITAFVNASGTDVGSSLGQMINKMDFDMDVLKNAKMGIPMGKQSMGQLFPEKTEAYYNGISASLMVAQVQAIQNIYLGKSSAGDGVGLDDYLVAINAQYNGGTLNDAIKAQFDATIGALQAVSDPFSANVTSANAGTAYTQVQKLLVLLKTDMPSALGVMITYNDNDGD
ncbi:imelysin family protein [Taibaiella soli]|uniref:Imelysin-like domain-containing protein n=1 Tax=Taibaiella soli TaxID=1649169 RepID=A0A2W2B2P7_9BACT|nr:imelysin family protein [Taibaiella soli]PZF74554.1 hypothetical protein DN068_02970 [Taibaiella soli]